MGKTNDALAIEDEQSWPALHAALFGQRAAGFAAVPPRSPGDPFAVADPFGILALMVGIDSHNDQRLALKAFYERPLDGHQGPAGRSPAGPAAQHHHLAAIITESEWDPVKVLTREIGCRLADGQALGQWPLPAFQQRQVKVSATAQAT